MSNRKLSSIIVVLVVICGGWYAFRPERLFINQTVSEQFPVASAANASTMTLASGSFHSVAHEARGTATIHQLPGGQKTLRLTDFETSNGPDLRLYLVAAADATDSDTVKRAGFIELGTLKGNIGDQNYDVPPDTDLSKYKAVTVWCKRFGVNFATAPLSSQTAGANAAAAEQPVALASGNFHDVSHKGSGTATVYQLADGKRVLRFTDFETSNGPDVVVYLVAAPDANDADTVKNSSPILLGSLKGNVGEQNYDLPADVDLARYRAVTIWCRRFSANFATAPLMSRQS